MPRPKTKQQFYGLHLAIFSALEKHIEGRGYDFSVPSNPAMHHPDLVRVPGAFVPLNRDEILTLIRVAEYPQYLSSMRLFENTNRVFASLFAKWPDEVLDILCFIRKKLAGWRNNQAALVTVFLRTHRFIDNKKGGNLAVANMTDKEVAQYFTRGNFVVTADSVKMARQKIARDDDKQFFFTEHPQIQEYMRGTGGMVRKGKNAGEPTEKLKRLLCSHLKGKK